MTIIKLPRLCKSDCAIFIRSSGGNNRWKDCRANRIFKTRRQLERIRHSKRDIPAHAEVFEVIAHPPGKGKRYRELVDGVTSGQIRTLIVEDVDRLTHTVFGLGVFWARRIKRFGLNLFVINYDPYHLISASLFLALVKTHEDEHQHKIPKRREKGFARSKRLPACTVNKGGILCVDHIRYCINIHPVLKLARKVARRKNMTRKEIYKEVAGILNMKGFISHNCVT